MACSSSTDSSLLVREGTSQPQRAPQALDPAAVPVDARTPAHDLVFAQSYARYLRYFGTHDVALGTWEPFFAADVAGQLAVAAVQDVTQYRTRIKEFFAFLTNLDNQLDTAGLTQHLGYLFSAAGSLAQRLDTLQAALPTDQPLRATLQNLIRSQLATSLRRLLAYYKADVAQLASARLIANVEPGLVLLGGPTVPFATVYQQGLSGEWLPDGAASWEAYLATIAADSSAFGAGATVFARINHLATHNLFTGVFDQFLKGYARVVAAAKQGLEASLTSWPGHAPHMALLLAFLRLREYSRQATNTLTQRHLDFYYREVLRLREKPAAPAHAHLLVELGKQTEPQLLTQGTLFKAGKDSLGKEAFFANDRDFVANQAQIAALKTMYRHGDERVGTGPTATQQAGRLYAAPVANSADGLGAALTTADQSWHPFFNKRYQNGQLLAIDMPPAELGFALASHYLLLAEGTRTITVTFTLGPAALPTDLAAKLSSGTTCLLSTAQGWLEVSGVFTVETSIFRSRLAARPAGRAKAWLGEPPGRVATSLPTNSLQLKLTLTGAAPAITPYLAKTHGYQLDTILPVLLVKLQQPDQPYAYPLAQALVVTEIALTVDVKSLRTLALSNDFGPVDASKPFQPFGAVPVAGSALLIGSKEAFQKHLTSASAEVTWLNAPAPYPNTATINVTSSYLQDGKWQVSVGEAVPITGAASTTFTFPTSADSPALDAPAGQGTAYYTTASRHGFIKLELSADFGQAAYQAALLTYLRYLSQAKDPDNPPPAPPDPGPMPPVGPTVSALTLNYTATQTIELDATDASDFAQRQARFFHIAPFGQSEPHPWLNNANQVPLLPQFRLENAEGQTVPSEAELYLGLTGLRPPQQVALLFQVADGTADPLVSKPPAHLHWSYLRANEWVNFARLDVDDQTGGLLNSGLVTLAVPRDATANNSLLPSELHWLRVAVSEKSAAVCRLVAVAAQGLRATFADQGNDPAFGTSALPAGTITKLAQPVAAIKKVTQPFAAFGGRGQEAPVAFYTRVSERLRHKDRGVALWDYERLVLEAFPQIYQVKCLNHTYYEPTASGLGTYRELAPGHVTVVTIPNLHQQNQRDPLRPYTSLGLLQEITDFLQSRCGCFVQLHVKNPQFEPVQVSFKVRLRPGFDETFSIKQLQAALTRFLSPWAFAGGGSGPSFGGKVYKSVLINFVEEQASVDYVTDFQLFHPASGSADYSEVSGLQAVSILVSAPAEQHLITVIDPAEPVALPATCSCPA